MEDFVASLPLLAFGSAALVSVRAARERRAQRIVAAALQEERVPRQKPFERVTQDDIHFAEIARAQLRTVPRPVHSNFLVSAVLSYAAEGDAEDAPLRHVCGVNTETCVLPSAICAERCALLQLRLRAPPLPRAVHGVYITTTETGSGELITPGLLCREMLCEFGTDSTRVFLFSADWQPMSGGLANGRGKHSIYTLGDLYPMAPIFHRVPRGAVLSFANAFAARMAPVNIASITAALATAPLSPTSTPSMAPGDVLSGVIVKLYEAVVVVAGKTVAADQLYPIHYAAGACDSYVTACSDTTCLFLPQKRRLSSCTPRQCTGVSQVLYSRTAQRPLRGRARALSMARRWTQ